MMVALALAVVVLVIIICILLVAFAEQRVQYETRILNLQKEHKQFLEELNRRIEDMRAENLICDLFKKESGNEKQKYLHFPLKCYTNAVYCAVFPRTYRDCRIY